MYMPTAAGLERNILALSAMVALSFAPANAFSQSCNNASPEAPHVAVAASGGISKGAYQAGALWAIIQVERAKRAKPAVDLTRLRGHQANFE